MWIVKKNKKECSVCEVCGVEMKYSIIQLSMDGEMEASDAMGVSTEIPSEKLTWLEGSTALLLEGKARRRRRRRVLTWK